VTDETYNLDEVLVVLDVLVLDVVLDVLESVAALANGITETISNTRIMLMRAVFFFMISPIFPGKEPEHDALFIHATFGSLPVFPLGIIFITMLPGPLIFASWEWGYY